MLTDSSTALPSRGPLVGLAWGALALQVTVFLAPVALVLWLSLLAATDFAGQPSLVYWASVLASPQALAALFSSVLLAALTALCATIIASPLAFVIAIRGRFFGRAALDFVIVMWLFDPGMRILGWMQVFKDIEIAGFPPSMVPSGFVAELIARIHAWVPPAVLVLTFAFRRTDRRLLQTAWECGATSTTLFRCILWPLCWRAVALSTALVFSGAVGSFLEPRLLGTERLDQASEWLQRALESETGWPYAAAMLLIMLTLAALPLLLLSIFDQRKAKP